MTEKSTPDSPPFLVVGAANDPSGCLIPCDPTRLRFSSHPSVAALQKWERFAFLRIGLCAYSSLKKHGLSIVPTETLDRLLVMADPTMAEFLDQNLSHSPMSSGTEKDGGRGAPP